MMMQHNNIKLGILSMVGCIILVTLSLRPIRNISYESAKKTGGIVANISTSERNGDIILSIADDNGHYYINRGTQSGLNVREWRYMLQGRLIRIHYARHWTPLDPFCKYRHVTRISINEEILYNEY